MNTQTRADWKALEVLFRRYLDGDENATRVLFSEIMRALQGYFRVRVGVHTDAEDLLQATLLKIHFARDRFDPKQSLKTWVFTIASRSLIDHWRGSKESSFETADEEGASPLDLIPSEVLTPEEKTRLHTDLNRALESLKPLERSIVYLYGVEEFSMAEIAKTLGLTEGATKLRAHRAYQELRKILEAK
jgi:RNA polymerase sigma-70 factor, ECF subfamily